MANFHSLEMEVIRHAEANKLLEINPVNFAGDTVIFTVAELCTAIVDGKPSVVSDAMGRVAMQMIILCAMLDIDLSKCLEQAFAKISAKPEAPSNILFLKKE